MKNQTYKNKEYKSSSKHSPKFAHLGTVEADACGHYGNFNKSQFLGKDAIEKILSIRTWQSFLDIGAGKCQQSNFLKNKTGKAIYTNDISLEGKNCSNKHNYDFVGEFQNINFKNKKFDVVCAIHVLEHVLNVNFFLKKMIGITKENGYLCIVVPIRKPFVVSGHMTIWNPGLLLYNLVVAGLDCRECMILQKDYEISVIVKVNKRDTGKDHLILHRDSGDLKELKNYFPKILQESIDEYDCFDGDIFMLNWDTN
jgi:SAM-dependent methyltransferase